MRSSHLEYSIRWGGISLRKEERWQGMRSPVTQARGAISKHEFLLGARDAYVEQAAFFIAIAVFQGTLVGKDAFLQPHEVHYRKFPVPWRRAW